MATTNWDTARTQPSRESTVSPRAAFPDPGRSPGAHLSPPRAGRQVRMPSDHRRTRLLDVCLASIALVALLPIGLLVAAVLATTGERTVFFRQRRVGFRKRIFTIVKFRTMYRGSEVIGTQSLTIKDDPRLLPLGRLLERSKLNEAPQFWNVVRGEMSLVGPRPLIPEHFSLYPRETRERITSVKPGLTGLGSLVLRAEKSLLAEGGLPPREIYTRRIVPRKATLETWYANHKRLALDIRLLSLTTVALVAPNSSWLSRKLRALEQQAKRASRGFTVSDRRVG